METAGRRLDIDQCLDFLQARRIGRVAVTHQALPVVVPVEFTVADGAIVFRADADGVLGRACDDAVVAFEVDDLGDQGPTGTTVMVVGRAWVLDSRVAVPLNRVSGRQMRWGPHNETS